MGKQYQHSRERLPRFKQPEYSGVTMQSRSSGYALLIGFILVVVLLALGALAVPRLLEQWHPVEEAERTIREGIDARLNPTPTIRPDPTTIIRQVQSLSRLETTSYTVEKVITAESGQDALAFLFGDRLLFVAHGRVIAGVDLGKIGEGDITITDDDRVIIVLPPPEIFVVALDNDRSYVYDRDTGLFGMNPELETGARQAAEEEILKAALEDGILRMAEANARAYLERLILAFGFREVVFIPATPVPTPSVLPVTVVPSTPTP
ncbi:MAG TPA: DUF4230 domain-containing protein [Anaerolineales bacterium]|nr:DUF4230 domain-containing protein [Anaerolineales bacterium]